jgi:hypothetical protein
MTNQELKNILSVVAFLIQKADRRGLTHGEKHHLMQVAMMVLMEAQNGIGDTIYRYGEMETPDVSDIPF